MTIVLGKGFWVIRSSFISTRLQTASVGRSVSTASAIKQSIRRSAQEPRSRPPRGELQEDRLRSSRTGDRHDVSKRPTKNANFSRGTPSSSSDHASGRSERRSSDRLDTRRLGSGGGSQQNRGEGYSRNGTEQPFRGRASPSRFERGSRYGTQSYDGAVNSRNDVRAEKDSYDRSPRGKNGYGYNSNDESKARTMRSDKTTANLYRARSNERLRNTNFDDEDDHGNNYNGDRDVDRPTRTSTDTPGNRKTQLSIPYTTPASQFLFGTSVVTAALKSKRRKLYKLYLYRGNNRSSVADDSIQKLARLRGIETTITSDASLLDKMSGGRPHNSAVLEASPLAKMPIVGLQPVERIQDPLHVTPDHQTREDEAINGTSTTIKYSAGFPRYPFLLMLDGILDPGNLGAILRTAYFLGVDAVVISTLSAPLNPVTLKASAGAVESLPLLSVQNTGAFVRSSQEAGWKFFAAVAPPKGPMAPSGAGSRQQEHLFTTSVQCPLRDGPCVLMLGSEGTGLKPDLQRKADCLISIDGHRAGQGGVDSLNVSVAAGLLVEAFLQKPLLGMAKEQIKQGEKGSSVRLF